jgi:hypothetical protein
MMQMKKQNRQIIILFNVISQLASITKFKRKLIVMFLNEDFIITNFQRISNKKVVKFTKRAQITRIETFKVKKTKIHEKSIEFLIFLNFETTRFEQKNALFVNKHVSSQLNRVDSIINAFNITNHSITNQSFSESIVVDVLNITHDFVSVSIFVFVSILETTFISTHQWLSRNVILINNHSLIAIVFNIFDKSLSSSFIDIVSAFFNENVFIQITSIILQKFSKRARREVRQQVKNVYSYDFIINQIIRSFFNNAFSAKAFNHLFFYLFQTINIQISTSTSAIKKIKQRRDTNKFRNKSRENDVERDISRTWIFFLFLFQTILEQRASTENCLFCNTMCTSSRT